MRRNLCFNFSFSPSMSAFSWRKFQLELKQISHLLRVISSSKWDSLKQHQKKKQLLVGTFFICSLVKIKRNLKKTPFNAQRYMKNLMHWNFHIFFHIIFRGCSESAKFFFRGKLVQLGSCYLLFSSWKRPGKCSDFLTTANLKCFARTYFPTLQL